MNTPQHPTSSRNIFPWMGSKRRLSKEIIARLPAHECYCEPFAGSAAVFFRKPPSYAEILNDVCGDIVNFFRVIQRHLPEFLRMFEFTIGARQEFDRLRATPPEVLTDIERAARFYYLQKCGFGGKYAKPTFGTATTPGARAPTLQRDKMRQDLTAACARLENVQVENLPWQECLARYNRAHTLFFMDPPYFQQTGYGVEFGEQEYTQLAHAMRTMQGKAALTINDCPEMRAVFDGLHVAELRSQYSISRNREGKARRTELLITNYPVDYPAARAQAGLPDLPEIAPGAALAPAAGVASNTLSADSTMLPGTSPDAPIFKDAADATERIPGGQRWLKIDGGVVRVLEEIVAADGSEQHRIYAIPLSIASQDPHIAELLRI